jgi:methyl-accepting chemotaxis protein
MERNKMRISDLKIAYKLAIYVVISAMAMAAIGFTGYVSLRHSAENMRVYDQRVVVERALAGEQLVVRKMQIAMLDSAVARPDVQTELTPYEKQRNYVKEAMAGNIREYEKNWESYKANAPDKIEIQQGIEDSEKAWNSYRDTMLMVDDLLIGGREKEAMELYVGPVKDSTTEIKRALGVLEEDTLKDIDQVKEQNAAELGIAVRNMMVATLIGLLLLSAFTWWIVREIRVPLQHMMGICQDLYQCDFRDKASADVDRQDEFGEMVRTIERMRQRLRKLLEKIQESSMKITGAAGTLTQTSMQSAEASSQIAGAVSQAAEFVGKQQSAVRSSTEAMTEVSGSVEQIRVDARIAADNSGKAKVHAIEGAGSIEASMDKMQLVQASVQSSAELVNKLGKRSQEIGQIVDAITAISGQTNLLALNAAIEAARAGEYGRGFAVVADEVRKLAEQSQQAAEQIAVLIRAIQSDTLEAVASMEEGRTQVEQGTQLVQDMEHVFKSIEQLVVDASSQMDGMGITVALAAQNTERASGQEAQIHAHGLKVSDEIQSVSAAAQEQSAAAEEVAAASESLNRLAKELDTAIQEFQF